MLWKREKIRKKVRTTEVNKIVTVVLKKDDISYADEAYQWNYGQILRIQGGNLPKAMEVHFSLEETSGTSVTRIGTAVDGVTEAPIPDSLLENNNCSQDYTIYAYIYLEDGTAGRTEYEIAIPVKARTKPEVPGTPEEPELFRETVKAVNDAADRAEQAEQNAKASATEAGKYAAGASESADAAKKTKEDALREVGEKKQEAIEAIQKQEETSVGKIINHTDDEIQRILNQTVESKGELEQTIKNAGVSKEELDESIQIAGDTKKALDKSTELAGTAKAELDTSIREAGEAKTALDGSAKTAGEMQETLNETVKQAGALDTSLGEKIETGTQLNEDITASGEKAVQDIQNAGSEQMGKMQAVAEEFTADREQITTNKENIGSIKEDMDALIDIQWIDGIYISTNGLECKNNAYKATGFIDLSEFLFVFKYSLKANKNIRAYALYDERKRYINGLISSSDTTETVTGVVDPDDSAKYIRFSTQKDDTVFVKISDISNFRIANGSISNEKLSNKSVTCAKLSDDILEHDRDTNFINFENVIAGCYIDNDGKEAYSSGLYATDFIELESGIKYYVNNVYGGYYAFYDSDRKLVASEKTLGTLTNPFMLPDGAAYGRFTIIDSSYTKRNAWISKNSTKPAKYGYISKIYANIKDDTITEKKIKDRTITVKKLDFVKHDEKSNYIKEWIENTYIDKNGVETKYNGFYASEPIFLLENTQYYINNVYGGYYAFYAADDTVIESHGLNDPCPNPFSLPAGATYMRVTCTSESDKNLAWISTINSRPIPYRETIDTDKIGIDIESANPCEYTGNDICAFSKGLCIGDSLTSGTMNHNDSGKTEYISCDKYSYPRNLERLTGINVTNMGRGGNTSAEWYSNSADTDLSGYDFAIIQLGVNDSVRYKGWTDTSVVAFTNIINKLKRENKNIKIFVATIIPAKSYNGEKMNEVSQGIREFVANFNDKNVILLDMAKYAHTNDVDAYNCGHLSAYGYYRLAKDYKSYISYYMSINPGIFKEIQFIGTDYWYDNPNS